MGCVEVVASAAGDESVAEAFVIAVVVVAAVVVVVVQAFGPVSYTHLDVYKRQQRYCSTF